MSLASSLRAVLPEPTNDPESLASKDDSTSPPNAALIQAVAPTQALGVRYEAIARQGHQAGTIVHARPEAVLGRSYADDELQRPNEEDIQSTVEKTKQAIQAKLGAVAVNTNASRPAESSGPTAQQPQIIRYTSVNPNSSFNSGASQRLVKVVQRQVDPLEPSKFKVQKSVGIDRDAPVPVLRDAPQKATQADAQAWVIPPSLSNWNNSKGFTVGLDKRFASEGRGVQDMQISSKFSSFADALDAAQQTAREQVAYRARLEQQRQLQQREKEDAEAKELARLARLRRAGIHMEAEANETEDERRERMARDAVRNDMRKDQEDAFRRERMGSKAKAAASSRHPTGERDISEKIALGQTVPKTQGDNLYEQRLFNQTQGLDHGWVNDEEYNLYDKSLLSSGREEALYRANQRQGEIFADSFSADKFASSLRPDKPFSGTEGSKSSRSGPIQFEKDGEAAKQQHEEEMERQKAFFLKKLQSEVAEIPTPQSKDSQRQPGGVPSDEADPIDSMLSFMTDAKSGRKRDRESAPSSRGPTLGMMHAVGGSSGSAEDYRESKRSKIHFVPTSTSESTHEIRETERRGDYERESKRHEDRFGDSDDGYRHGGEGGGYRHRGEGGGYRDDDDHDRRGNRGGRLYEGGRRSYEGTNENQVSTRGDPRSRYSSRDYPDRDFNDRRGGPNSNNDNNNYRSSQEDRGGRRSDQLDIDEFGRDRRR